MRLLPALLCLTLFGVAGGPVHAQPRADERIIIFFAWDKPVIDGDAAARLDAVAAAFLASPRDRLIVSGHADRSGPAGPNARASRRRAEAVAAHLAARGVPGAAMTIVSHGEARPLIETADGVREPQNRRVEIVRTPGT